MIDTRPFVETLPTKRIAVFGLGVSGMASARALRAGGAHVAAWDDSDDTRNAAQAAGIELFDFSSAGLAGFDMLVLSPGVPLYYPAPHACVVAARAAGVGILCDIEILHRLNPGLQTIGITGTNGKSTTTALISHILKSSGMDVMTGGNIGAPVLDLAWPKPGGVLVLELSSYQLDLCPTFRPDISVLLNITPDHLDRHGTMENYAAAKERIFEGKGSAICGIDDSYTAAIFDRTEKTGLRTLIPLSLKKEAGIFVREGLLFDARGDAAAEIGPVGNFFALPGAHNQQNIMAAYAVCRTLGLLPEEILEHVKTYPGLPHRQQATRVINGISYVNDSKATNGESAARAVACYNNIYLIAGGMAKEGGLSALEPFLDKIRHVFLIGAAMDEFALWAEHAGIPHTKSHTLDIAVLEAHRMAQAERGRPGGAGTVLLSPACASWDQFRNYGHRGDVFVSLVNALSEDV